MRKILVLLVILILLAAGTLVYLLTQKAPAEKPPPPPPEPVSYNFEILPVLKKKCASCHENQDDLVRLQQDLTALEKPLVSPGHPEKSPLYLRLANNDAKSDPQHHLSDGELGLFERWILTDGHPAPHWASQPLAPETAPNRTFTDESDFLNWYQKISQRLLGQFPDPPTRRQAAALFRENPGQAPLQVLDPILTDPRSARFLAAEWLDLADQSDNRDPALQAYRAWVLRAFAENQPLDQFISAQTAGDLKDNPQREDFVATGFLRARPPGQRPAFLASLLLAEPAADLIPDSPAVFRAKFENPRRQKLGEPLIALPTEDDSQQLAQLQKTVAASEKELAGLRDKRDPAFKNWLLRENKVPFVPDLLALYPLDSADGPHSSVAVKAAAAGIGPEFPLGDGIRGKAPVFDGRETIAFPDVLSTRPQDRFTISGWFKFNAADERARVVFSSNDQAGNPARGLFLILQNDSLQATLATEAPGNSISQKTPPLPIPPKIWHHFALSYDGSMRSDGLRLFLNGQELDTETVDRPKLRPTSPVTAQTFYLGGHPGLLGFQNGSFDELSFHERDLTLPEIKQLATGKSLESSDIPEAGLKNYYFSALQSEARQIAKRLDHEREQLAGAESHIQQAAIMLPAGPASTRRLELAGKILADPQCARVLANRYHLLLTGRSLSATPGDFSPSGAIPAEAGLLDFYADSLLSSGWNLRNLLREILLREKITSDPAPTAPPNPTDSSAAYPPQNAPTKPSAPAKADISSPPGSTNSAPPTTRHRPTNEPVSQ